MMKNVIFAGLLLALKTEGHVCVYDGVKRGGVVSSTVRGLWLRCRAAERALFAFRGFDTFLVSPWESTGRKRSNFLPSH